MATSKKPTTHQVYNPNTKLLNINNGQKVKDVSTGKVYGPKNGLTAQQQAGRASLRAGTPVPQQVKSPTTHQVYKNGVLTVTPTQASKASTPEGQLAAKEGIFTNPHTGIQTDKYGNVVTGKNKYGVLQTTGTTAPSAMGTAGAATQGTAVRGTTTQGAVTPTVPTATTPVVDIGGGTTAGVSGTAGAATDSQRLADIAWKQHNGEPLSEEDFKYLVGQQLSGAGSLAAQTQAAATAQETAAQDLIAKKQAEMEARASSQSKTTQGLVDQQKALLDEQAKAAIDQIKQNAMSEQTAGQNIMAFSGFGVSSAAIQKTQEIQAKYNAQSQAVVDAENLQLQQYQAQLQGADQAVLDEMQANIDTLQANADEMAYSNALDVAQANADAQLDPLTALSNIMQVLPPAQAQQVNTDVSKMLGYLADESGNPITFANGETIPIKTDTDFAKNMDYLQQLASSGASEEVMNAAMAGLGLTTADMQNFQFYSQLSDKGKADYIKLQQASKGVSLFNGADGQVYAVDGTNGTVTPLESQSASGSGNIPNMPPVTATIGDREVTAQPVFMTALQQADAAMFAATGQHIQINQDYRTAAEQQAIRDQFGYTSNDQPSGAGGLPMAAPVGTSFHEMGLAVDVSNWEEAQPYLEQFGIVNGLEGDMGHFSMGEMNPGVFGTKDYTDAQKAAMDALDPSDLSTTDLKVLKDSGLSTNDLFTYVSSSKQELPADKKEQIQEVYDALLDLEGTSGLTGAVGFGIQKFGTEAGWAGTKTADFIAKFNTFKDSLALPNLDKMKGAMSDKDIQFLRNTASALSLNMSETEFRNTLEKLKQKYSSLLNLGTDITPQEDLDPNSILDSIVDPDVYSVGSKHGLQ